MDGEGRPNFYNQKFSAMQQSQTNSSQDVKTEPGAENTGKPRQAADDKTQQDADEQLPETDKGTSGNNNPKEVDELMQGKKLEKMYRGGDAQDADEFKE
jgi:hypothetical protein